MRTIRAHSRMSVRGVGAPKPGVGQYPTMAVTIGTAAATAYPATPPRG